MMKVKEKIHNELQSRQRGKKSGRALLPSEACAIGWRPFFPPQSSVTYPSQEAAAVTSCSVVSLLPPARWQRGQPASRCSSPFTVPGAPLADKEEGEERAALKCKCLLNELRSDTRPLEFGAFKQPSSSSFLLLLCLPSSLHTVLLSSLYCGWSCWAAAFKRGASVTGSRGRASSSACGRALKLEEGGK